MKPTAKIFLLVALALFLTLTACTRTASTSPVSTPTVDLGFPVDETPQGVTAFATQTAQAMEQQFLIPTATPEVLIATEAPPTTGDPVTQPTASGDPAVATAAPVVATTPLPAGPRPATYALQNGEWPICIARRYNLDIGAFFQLNGLTMNSKPAAGTVLRIPATGTWSAEYGRPALIAHPATYTVAAGDTIYTIACRFGDVSPEAILSANNLANPTDIRVGQQLQIP